MNRSRGIKRKKAHPPLLASAAKPANVSPIPVCTPSIQVNSTEEGDVNGAPPERHWAPEHLASKEQHHAANVVNTKDGLQANDNYGGRSFSVPMVVAPDALSCSVDTSATLFSSEPILSSADRLTSEPVIFSLASAASPRATVPESRSVNQLPIWRQVQHSSRARATVFRPSASKEANAPRGATAKMCPPSSLASCAAPAPGRSYASTSPQSPASPESISTHEEHARNTSVSRSSWGQHSSPPALPLQQMRTDVEVQGSDTNVIASSDANTRRSALSRQNNTAVSATVVRKQPNIASVLLPSQQLLENGYYLASDESANSSFSDTPRSARRISLGSSSSLRTTMQRLDRNSSSAVGGGESATLVTDASPHSIKCLRNSWDPNSYSRGNCSDDGSDIILEEENEVGNFDEEDEEQAVLTYMDSGVDGNLVGSSSLSNQAPPPPSARQGSSSTGGACDRPSNDPGNFRMSIEVGDTDYDIGEDPPSCMPASPSRKPNRRGAPPLCTSLRSGRTSVTADLHAPTMGRRPSIGRKASGAPPIQGAGTPLKLATATTAPCMLSRQHSTVSAATTSRPTPLTTAAAHAPPSSASSSQCFASSPHVHLACTNEEELRATECKQLSLYEAFFVNPARGMWLVDDQVLAKILEYVRIMGYEHPALKRDRLKGQASLWSSSSAIASPIAPAKPKKKAACRRNANSRVLLNTHTSASSAAAEAVAEALAQPDSADAPSTLPNGASGCAESATFATNQFCLKTGKPHCARQYVNRSTATSASHLFLTFGEAMRWIAEQEYVIGTVLLCCARFVGDPNADGAAVLGDGISDTGPLHSRRKMLQRRKPCIPLRFHPIHFVASLVCSRFPQWGGMPAFTRAWETQIRLVLGSASPSHQRLFKFPDDGLVLSSDCEAGNLHRVERAWEPYSFFIWLEPDLGSDKRIWFRFSVSGAREGRRLRFRLMNAAPHVKLYRQNGMMPVWRDGLSQPNWGPVDSCSFRTTNRDLDGEVNFSIAPRNSTETIQIAFCTPYTYADLLCHVCHWHALVKTSGSDMRFEERVLCRSPDGRKLHLLIVTSRAGGPPASAATEDNKRAVDETVAAGRGRTGVRSEGMAATGADSSSGSMPPSVENPTTTIPPGKGKGGAAKEAVRGPYANFASGKKVVLVSGRVHPGEVTASHAVHGLISFLLSSDVRAIQLREHFIFFIVPMLNPDSVSRGHSRMDQFGKNLNRCYNNPNAETEPTVLALRRVFEHLQHTYRERFIMYLDFHSHASQSSSFMFGNSLPVSVQHWNLFFPRLVELHARHVFSFALCRFGRVHMTSKDGASRVLFGSSLIHSYTVELPHFTDHRLYADDYVAMNNGSNVLFEVTWPSLHPTPGQAGSSDVNEDGAQASENGPEQKSRRANSSCRGVVRPGTGARGVGKRSSMLLSGRGRACRSNREVSSDAAKDGSLSRQSARASAGRRRHANPTDSIGSAPFLQPISAPTILCQSAEVGQACLLALRDYCFIGARPSPELMMVGGMDSVLRDSKRQVKLDASRKCKKSKSLATYAGISPIYKQY